MPCGTDNYSELPTTAQIAGDMYNIKNAGAANGVKVGDNVVWNGESWDNLSGFMDMSEYTKTVDLTGYVRLASPAFTGKPTAPTANTGTGTTQVATTEFVDNSLHHIKWKLGSRHPAEDICGMYANADLYGLGKGVFPKDAAPVNPAHPHCLCHYAPVYRSELEGKKQSDNVEENGRAWLEQQPLHIRQAILGVKGEQEWKAGRVGWMEKARNLSISIQQNKEAA